MDRASPTKTKQPLNVIDYTSIKDEMLEKPEKQGRRPQDNPLHK